MKTVTFEIMLEVPNTTNIEEYMIQDILEEGLAMIDCSILSIDEV